MSTATDDEHVARKQPEVGAAPRGPWRLGMREWIDTCKRAAWEFVADDCTGLAQQVAFSSLLAFFPAVIFLLGLLGLFGPEPYDELTQLLGPVAPSAVLDAVDLARDASAGNKAGSAVAFVVGLVGATWAASGAMGAVTKAVNRAYDRPETRPFWKVRLIAIVLVFLTGLVTIGMFVLIVFGGPIGEAIADRAALGGFETVWAILRWPIGFGAILLFFSLVYYLAPNVEHRNWRWVTPGSLAGGLGWIAISGLFALYTSFSGSYEKTYGTLAGGVILLLWLNYSAFALLFGAELNAELDRQADIHVAGGPDAGLVTLARRTR